MRLESFHRAFGSVRTCSELLIVCLCAVGLECTNESPHHHHPGMVELINRTFILAKEAL